MLHDRLARHNARAPTEVRADEVIRGRLRHEVGVDVDDHLLGKVRLADARGSLGVFLLRISFDRFGCSSVQYVCAYEVSSARRYYEREPLRPQLADRCWSRHSS